jgi:hypothetical protein
MNDKEREEADRLWDLIRAERDPTRFCALVQQLSALLDRLEIAPSREAA